MSHNEEIQHFKVCYHHGPVYITYDDISIGFLFRVLVFGVTSHRRMSHVNTNSTILDKMKMVVVRTQESYDNVTVEQRGEKYDKSDGDIYQKKSEEICISLFIKKGF